MALKIKTDFYLKLGQRAWRMFRENIWLFWIFWCVNAVSHLENLLPCFIWSKIKNPDIPFFQSLFFLNNNQPFWLAWQHFVSRASVKLSLLPQQLDITGFSLRILSFFILLLMLKPIRNIFRRTSVLQDDPSAKLIKVIFPIALICLVISTFFHCYYSYWQPGMFPLSSWRIPLRAIGIFWQIFLSSIITGFVLLLFLRKESEDISFFKPLFTVNLIIAGGRILFSLLFIKAPVQFALRMTTITCWPLLFFLFVPYAIVVDGLSWQDAFRRNFLIWRRKLPQVLVLLVLLLAVKFITVDFLPFLFSFCILSWLSIAETIVATGLASAVCLWTTAVILLFYQEMLIESSR